jgi:hypothetical protein
MLFVAAALALLVGLSLGLLGGGGSILTMPILRYVLGMEAHQAIALSLLVVGTTSLAAVVPHARRGRVRFRTGIVFGLAGMVGAYLAGRIAHLLPAALLLSAFALMMFATAFAMLRKRPAAERGPDAPGSSLDLPVAKVLVEGVIVGAVTGFVGAGGGFLVVPALVLLGKMPMEIAVGTSLVVIAMKSMAGFAGFLSSTPVDWTLGLTLSAAAMIGSVLGAALASRARPAALRTSFGWFVVAMGCFILTQELPPLLGGKASLVLSLAVSATSTGALALLRRELARIREGRSAKRRPPPASGSNAAEPSSQLNRPTIPSVAPSLDPFLKAGVLVPFSRKSRG